MNLNKLFKPEDVDPHEDDYWIDRDVTLVEVDLVEGSADDHATLIYHDGWKIKLYSGYHISYDVRISAGQAKDILQEVSSVDYKDFEWNAQDWVYVE